MRSSSRRRFRPRLDVLESRLAPATFRVDPNAMDGEANSLRAAILAANKTGAADTIIITSGTVFLTLGGDTEDKAASGDLDIRSPLIISGAGAQLTTIDASALGDRVFQNFGVNLTFNDVTISGGVADRGGGVYVGGGLVTMNRCVISDNIALGNSGEKGAAGMGGGIYLATGVLTLNQTFIENNQAMGGDAFGVQPDVITNFRSPDGKGTATINRGGHGERGGDGLGGGVYLAGGAIRFNSGALDMNQAVGGTGGLGGDGIDIAANVNAGGKLDYSIDAQAGGGRGGDGVGGGLYVAAGSTTFGQVSVTNNQAIGGLGGTGGRTDINIALNNKGGTAHITVNAGKSATGGRGGDGKGGGLVFSGAALRMTAPTLVYNNIARGGRGGQGALRFDAVINITVNAVNSATSTIDVPVTPLAFGGQGGDGKGGGLFLTNPNLQPTLAIFSRNIAYAGGGGAGGDLNVQHYNINPVLNNTVFENGVNLTNNINVPLDLGRTGIGTEGTSYGGGVFYTGVGRKPKAQFWFNTATNGADEWQG